MWIHPEKQYTRDLLAALFKQLSFALDLKERFFFVLEQADFMPPACGNSLLKSLEEPPRGYYFYLCAQREYTILPTIRSRCMIHQIKSTTESLNNHPLFDYFSSTIFYDPTLFLKELDQSGINERQSIELLDALFSYWMHKNKKALQENNKKTYSHTSAIVAHLSDAFKKPPMPGSSKIFWRNLYLQLKNV